MVWVLGTAMLLAPLVAADAAGAAADAGCKLTGGGVTGDGGRFRANAKVTKGEVVGRVKLRTAAGERFRGNVTALQCRRDGGGGPGSPEGNANIADVEGTGLWNGVPIEWAGTLHDHGEGNLTDRLADDVAITVVLPAGLTVAGVLVAGNVQIHPPNGPHP
jgi:hypothetical protein